MNAAATPRSFGDWMNALLRHYDLALPAHQEQEVYSLHFDGKPSVHFVKTPKGDRVDILVEADTLPTLHAADKLLRLLALNACHPCGHTAAVSVQPPSGAVLVWSRQRWATLDLADAANLVQTMLDKSDAVREEIRRQSVRPAARPAALGRSLVNSLREA